MELNVNLWSSKGITVITLEPDNTVVLPSDKGTYISAVFVGHNGLLAKKTSKKDIGVYNEVNWMTFVFLIVEYGHFS